MPGLDQTRREWEQGNARFQRELRETQRSEAVRGELDAVTAGLRRRIGQSFSLSELADLYATADDWARVRQHLIVELIRALEELSNAL